MIDAPVGSRLRPVAGRDLEGRDRRIPDDLDGPVFLFIAHYQSQQPQVDEWMALVASTGITALELPVMKRRYRPTARFIEGGMASNMSAEVRRRTICVYADVDAWRAKRRFVAEQSVTALLLDREGTILWLEYGPPTTTSATVVAAAAAQL